jgi:translation initiation factor 4B
VSIFGGAKPVDTAAREKEIEERLQKERGEVSRLPPRDPRSDDNRYALVHRSLSNFSVFMIVL